MFFREERINLFDVPKSYYLAHCISADFALGAGIAKEFDKRYGLRQALRDMYPDFLLEWQTADKPRRCLLAEGVLNLVTKERYYEKPSYCSLQVALEDMRSVCNEHDIRNVAMPLIGCGLDKLEWEKVKDIIFQVFKEEDIDILVCRWK